MSVMQNYGVLRVVSGNHGSRGKIAMLGSSVRDISTDQGQTEAQGQGHAFGQGLRTVDPLWSPADQGLRTADPLWAPAWVQWVKQRYKYLGRWLPEERLLHVLSQRETTIGRALSSDIILLDPTVSRDHARLVLDEHGWSVQNMTDNNVVRVNSHIVAGGAWSPIEPQDLLVIGNTTLQLVAPLPDTQSMDKKVKEARGDFAIFLPLT